MMLFDTHAHYDDKRFSGDRDSLLASMPDQGVGYIANIGTDLETSRQTVSLCDRFPHVWGAVGFHPHEAKSLTNEALDINTSDPEERAAVSAELMPTMLIASFVCVTIVSVIVAGVLVKFIH